MTQEKVLNIPYKSDQYIRLNNTNNLQHEHFKDNILLVDLYKLQETHDDLVVVMRDGAIATWVGVNKDSGKTIKDMELNMPLVKRNVAENLKSYENTPKNANMIIMVETIVIVILFFWTVFPKLKRIFSKLRRLRLTFEPEK